jgi:hypothetical protein
MFSRAVPSSLYLNQRSFKKLNLLVSLEDGCNSVSEVDNSLIVNSSRTVQKKSDFEFCAMLLDLIMVMK